MQGFKGRGNGALAARARQIKAKDLILVFVPMSTWRQMQSDFKKVRLTITRKILQRLQDEQAKTGLGAYRLLEEAQDVPEGLNPKIIQSWLIGRTKTARKDHLEYVLDRWTGLPAKEDVFVRIDDKLRNILLDYRHNTDMGPGALLRNTRHDRPEGLSSGMIASWLNGTVFNARKDHLEYVLGRWKSFAAKERRVQITQEILEELKLHRKRSGASPQKLLIVARNVPAGLSPGMIHQWFYKKCLTARPEHLKFVLETWKNLPDDQGQGRRYSKSSQPGDYVAITKEIRATLAEYKELSGIGAQRLLMRLADCPDGLSAAMVNNWLSGRTGIVFKPHLDYVLKKWKQACQNSDRVKLTDDIMGQLKAYREQGLLPGGIFQKDSHPPEGLNSHQVSGWLSKKTTTAKMEHLEYVLRSCKDLAASNQRKIKITEDLRKSLSEERKRTGVGLKAFLDTRPDAPQGLTPLKISGWINGHIKTARKDHIDYVMDNWRCLPDVNS